MSENKKQSPVQNAVSVLKEVNKNIKDNPSGGSQDKDQISAGEISEELRGSDADVDHSVGYDSQPSTNEAQEQKKGSDADSA